MVKIGVNEKSLPFELSWFDKLNCAKSCGYSFIELSIDETEDRISRLDWTKGQRLSLVEDVINTGVPIDTMMLSALRKFPLGSANAEIYDKSYEICQKAIILAKDLGIRNIQIAGYDEYYAAKSLLTRENFIENLRRVVNFASENQVMIAIETMDDKFINSIAKIREIKQEISSPWLQAYPDLGNISAWPENIPSLDLAEGLENIVSVHVKDTLSVTSTSPGKFKNVPFGEGDVEFFGLFKTLKRIGYSGTLTVEMWSEKNDNAVDLMIKAHTFVTELLSKAGLNIEN
ncbi:L-ribulose-5-phosphate 3-epimerase [Paucilactobacillus nenjiangensis]|uniref:L-ribulose-5-phosphate 3-epimerase n=1 Tax=Paucilactobacillus nenjiangensis TaxID=1296540 RepID=UPI0010F9CE04|nr:L-ribulose-5-phosphate 3-epimerase [Paucilactobacillus nenjiangensis]